MKNVKPEQATVHLMTDRRTVISPYAVGNPKLGPGIYTYDRLPGEGAQFNGEKGWEGTCPGATRYCQSVCYAMRIAGEGPDPVFDLMASNGGDVVPPVPDDATVVRWHVSGDFDTEAYARNWIREVRRRPDVQFFGYTRSWRLGFGYYRDEDQTPEEAALALALLDLRDEPNVQLFASLDRGDEHWEDARLLHANGWRTAYIFGPNEARLTEHPDGTKILVCPEETGRKANCVECGFCFRGQRQDVAFIEH